MARHIRQINRKWLVFVTLPTCILSVFSLILFIDISVSERNAIRLKFELQADHFAEALINNFHLYIDILYSIEGFFSASQQVEREEFQRFTRPLLERHKGIQALEWIYRLSHDNRQDVVNSVRSEGFHDFNITEVDDDGKFRVAGNRAEYYPVFYVEPYAGNESAMGFDLSSNPVRRAALLEAVDSAGPTASARVSLVQSSGKNSGILFFLPVYASGHRPSEPTARRKNLSGFALGVFRIDTMVTETLSTIPIDYRELVFRIFDETAAPENRLLHVYDHHSEGIPDIDGTGRDDFVFNRQFHIGRRQWRVQFAPTSQFVADHGRQHAYPVLFGGLLFSLLLGTLLHVMVNRNEVTEQMVAERTAELSTANDRLCEYLDRERVMEKIQESEARFRGVVESAPDAIIIVDESGKIRFLNAQTERLLGYTASELMDQDHDIIVPVSIRERHAEHRANYFAEPHSRLMSIGKNLFARRKDGSELPVEISLSPLHTAQGIQIISIIHDISVLREQEAELRQHRDQLEQLVAERTRELTLAMEKAMESDHLKSVFLAAMSHELRTPLNSIIGFTGILLQGIPGPMNKEQQKQLGMVSYSARHLLNLINDVLDISKIEAGELEVAIAPFDLPEMVENVVHSLTPLAEKKGLIINVDMDPGIEEWRSDPKRVEQILINLVNNAIKFTDNGNILLAGERHDSEVLIRVADTGIGMEAADLTKVFDAFRQLETGLSRRYEGTGLGLSICRKLLELLGGRIWAESKGHGQGSSFMFTLPLAAGGVHGR
ncbi:MAG: PAS domain S-box protein [Desulfobacteraceae bacterium]|nr:PAS domain S-box protein [Desulfobacteraceae bacterium]